MNDKIREVALKVARECGTGGWQTLDDMVSFGLKLVFELSKDVEPVAEVDCHHYHGLKWLQMLGQLPNGTTLYLHPPLTEQDKLDAERWRAYQKRKQDLLDRGFLRNPLRDETIDRAMENGK